MKNVYCPDCNAALELCTGSGRCAACHKVYRLEARCPVCQQPLEVLKACGAVDYFCRNGHGLISKKRVEFTPV
ncbi:MULTISPECIES: zinc ribbon domain-containing protein [Tenebrionibacter/Tenebrionicola group]|jgi:uncharacterized protein YbaR (Trm112 family)|uniref:Zinc ribbon domain-containing protein n=2 Tax=Tenebrionibacter/Tenebrionicola group TaxID=2969848 RepID=A0A8K0V861_9ENTR|nr:MULTISPECIES: zinc ribbon domain-containing protein [Tenebrionibacter/Tenebrionicola group]MBK4716022.1 zinc ribbon domain-containing protein [Tenebrionibacter intestinalis]MBV5096788.1 zinc ribbon domain-containing protein [Tenebrionicola larvae]